MGPGFLSAAVVPQANQQNKLNAFLFYDTGKYDYLKVFVISKINQVVKGYNFGIFDLPSTDFTCINPKGEKTGGIKLSF